MTKFDNLFRQGLYGNTLEAEKRFLESQKQVNVNYISVNYSTISDSAVSASEKELKEYYHENIRKYQQKESRNLKFVVFEVFPSERDNKQAEKWINDQVNEFRDVDNTEQYLNYYSDIPYDNTNYKYGELPEIYNDFMFSSKVGAIYGPYFENESYKIAKLAKTSYLPDSVKLRHILLGATNQNQYMQMKLLADSLKVQIEKGANFTRLAEMNSVDNETKNIGGELGWFTEDAMKNQYGLYFSDSCITAKPSDVKILPSQAGVHIIQIEKISPLVKKVQVGILEKRITPSDETIEKYYLEADRFAGLNNTYDKFINATKNKKPYLRNASNLKPMDSDLPGIENAREIVKWAYQADEKDVSNVFTVGNKFVIATVDKINEKGNIPFEDVKDQIEIEVTKQKKAELITNKINKTSQNINSIEELAEKLNSEVQTAQDIRFTSYTFSNSGPEPKIISAAVNVKPQTISKPIAGENGVYVLYVTDSHEPELNAQYYPMYKSYVQRNYAALANTLPYLTLEKLANVEDYRANFY